MIRIDLPGLKIGAARLFAAAISAAALLQPLHADRSAATPDSKAAQLIASSEPGWPQFRGPRRDGICDEKELLQTWPENGPKQLWSTEGIGTGFSAPIISGDRLFITGDVGDELHLFAFDLNGKKLWQTKNGAAWKESYPGARSSPAFSAGRVYHQNAHGRLACFDAQTGQEQWAIELLQRFGGTNITWGLSECVLVDERAVYATAGGREALAVAFNKENGELLWKSEPLHQTEGEKAVENPSYVSPILVSFAGRRLLIGCSLRHLYCVNADTGQLQWTAGFPTRYSVLTMMPVLVDDSIFMTAPHGTGGWLLKLTAPATAEGRIGVQDVWQTQLDTCQGGVVQVGQKLIGSFYSKRESWAALDAKTGQQLYSSGAFVKGAGLLADQRLYLLAEDGWMALIEPTETEFAVRGKFRFAEAARRDAWAHPVIHKKKLYLRYHDQLSCYDIARSSAPAK